MAIKNSEKTVRSKPATQEEDLSRALLDQAAASRYQPPQLVFELLQFSLLPSYA